MSKEDFKLVVCSDKDLELPVLRQLTRADVMLTPEESRLYERYSIEQVQAMAVYTPAVKTPENSLQNVVVAGGSSIGKSAIGSDLYKKYLQ